MIDNKILFSIIIPIVPGAPETIIELLSKINYPQDKIEVLLVEGNQPSMQRNKGAEVATGDILCFLDSDSIPDSVFLNQIRRKVLIGIMTKELLL